MLTVKIISFMFGTLFGGGLGMIISAVLFAAHKEPPKDNCNRCVCCGDAIPEGRQVCQKCEKGDWK